MDVNVVLSLQSKLPNRQWIVSIYSRNNSKFQAFDSFCQHSIECSNRHISSVYDKCVHIFFPIQYFISSRLNENHSASLHRRIEWSVYWEYSVEIGLDKKVYKFYVMHLTLRFP